MVWRRCGAVRRAKRAWGAMGGERARRGGSGEDRPRGVGRCDGERVRDPDDGCAPVIRTARSAAYCVQPTRHALSAAAQAA
jgi:hypothetical protein